MLLPLAVCKYLLASHTFEPIIDGGYYTDVARHVRDGLGLTTHVSLYHHAYPAFPHPSPVYPLWPLLYGFVGRFFDDLLRVGVWLPTGLYFSSLVFGYLWARSLAPRTRWLGFDLGHAFVMVLATTRDFYFYTSVPYTEGLAYTLLFVALWRAQPAWSRPTWSRGAEFGFWLGLSFLARSQAFVFLLAAFSVLAGASVLSRGRAGYLRMFAATVVVAVLVSAPHYIAVQQIVERNGLEPVLAFDQARASWILSDYQIMVKTDGLWDYIKDRASGIPVAFRYAGRYSYARQFHYIQYALPAALVMLTVGLVRYRRGSWADAWTWFRSPAAPGPVFFVVFALAGLLSIHILHKVYFVEWNFARRQSVSCIFAFFAAWIYLARHRYLVVRMLAILLLLGSTARGAEVVVDRTERSMKQSSPRPYFAALTRWLEREADKHDDLTIAINDQVAQRIAPYTTDIGYHWIHDQTTTEDLRTLVDKLGVRYVVLRKAEKHLRRNRKDRVPWFRDNMRVVQKLGGFTIYEPTFTE